MSKQLLYDLATLPPPEPNPLARKVGVLAGKTCKTCQFLQAIKYRDYRYYKCLKRGVTHSKSTDHRCKWHACAWYQDRNV